MATGRVTLSRLRRSIDDASLDDLCRRHEVELLVLFGSARFDADPGDIDLAVGFPHEHPGDLVGLVTDLLDLLDSDAVDVMDLDHAGPVAAYNALVGADVLFTTSQGVFATRQMRAISMYLEVKPLLDTQLELLANS